MGLLVARLHMLEPQMLGLSTVGRPMRHCSLVTLLWLLQQVLLLNELVKQKWLGRLVVLVLFLFLQAGGSPSRANISAV